MDTNSLNQFKNKHVASNHKTLLNIETMFNMNLYIFQKILNLHDDFKTLGHNIYK